MSSRMTVQFYAEHRLHSNSYQIYLFSTRKFFIQGPPAEKLFQVQQHFHT